MPDVPASSTALPLSRDAMSEVAARALATARRLGAADADVEVSAAVDTAALAAAPVAEAMAAPVIHEVFNPDAAASWNAAATFRVVPGEKEPSAEPVLIEVAVAPSPVETRPVLVSGGSEVFDPVRAAAWRSVMAGHVSDAHSRDAETNPVPVTAEPNTPPAPDEWGEETEPSLDEWGGRTGPVLGEEFLALIGNAAHQASLDAFDALDQTSTSGSAPEPRERPRPRSSARSNRPAPSRKERRRKPRPAQDEWGMFDPSQCGPDALFDDEDAWDEEPDDRRPSPRGRSAA